MDKKFIVTYDLSKPGQEYKALYEALEDLGAERIVDSTWELISQDGTASFIGQDLGHHLDVNDRLFVAEIVDPHQFGAGRPS